MGTAERRERQRQGLREKILEAARELFTELGYEAVSMRKIAEKIEYSPTTIYLHFADKEALVRELCTTDLLGLAERFGALEQEPDPVRRLRGVGAALLGFARERPNHYRMMFMTPHPPVAAEKRGIERGNVEVDAWAFLKACVVQAQHEGRLSSADDPEVVAQLLFAGIHGIAALHIAKANDPWIPWRSMEEVADRMIDVLLRGCGWSEPPQKSTPPKPKPGRRAVGRRRPDKD